MSSQGTKIVAVCSDSPRERQFAFGSTKMAQFNPLLWPKTSAISSYGIAVPSVVVAATISLWPPFHLQSAPAPLFLCAVLVGAWFAGSGPGLVATSLSALAFYYYFLSPIYSLGAKPGEIPRLAIFILAALFVESLSAAHRRNTESLRRGRDDLKVRVQEIHRINEALQAESRERIEVENRLRCSEALFSLSAK
jgi:K+-sensing histidine kinase KdpD